MAQWHIYNALLCRAFFFWFRTGKANSYLFGKRFVRFCIIANAFCPQNDSFDLRTSLAKRTNSSSSNNNKTILLRPSPLPYPLASHLV